MAHDSQTPTSPNPPSQQAPQQGVVRGLVNLFHPERRRADRLRRKFADAPEAFWPVHEACKPFTMTHTSRLLALWRATRDVVQRGVPGDLVECGVYRGGSAMAMAMTLMQLQESERRVWLYDTYEGMPPSTEADRNADGRLASEMAQEVQGEWLACDVDTVRANVRSTGWPDDRAEFVAGRVEETIPDRAPETVAILRLDTDWFESTDHTLRHLYPRLSPGGILILDDYGYWEGAREAVDQYLAELDHPLTLERVDEACRIAVKPG